MNTPNVLIVEDDPFVQNIHQHYLNKLNCKCTVAKNGNEALQLCKQNHFDLIFMDFNLPDMQGTEITKKIRKNKINKMPIIAVTAHGEKIRKKCVESGMNGLIAKPASIKQFENALQNCMPDDLTAAITNPRLTLH